MTRLLFFTAILLASSTVTAQSQLFIPTEGGITAPSIAAIAAQRVEIQSELLTARSSEIVLELPDGPVVTATMISSESRPEGVVWRGQFRDDPDSHVGLTLHQGFLSGRISSIDGIWEIRPQANGVHSVEKLADELFPACGVDHSADADLTRGGDPDPCPSPVDPIDKIDLMILYTQDAMNSVGGQAQIEALGQSAVDRMNESFMNSQMSARVNLVHIEMSAQNDTGNFSSDLGWLGSNAGVAALRDQYQADMVGMFNNNNAFCGLGQFPSTWGAGGNPNTVHQVTYHACAVGNLSYAHEHGHNMGFEHDPANGGNPGSGTYPYRFGHFVSGSYRTVMSYSNQCTGGCPRNPYFSNPSVNFMGVPTGLADQRENWRVGVRTTKCVTDYRSQPPDLIYLDGLEDGS